MYINLIIFILLTQVRKNLKWHRTSQCVFYVKLVFSSFGIRDLHWLNLNDFILVIYTV
jgi:hypothetical protein